MSDISDLVAKADCNARIEDIEKKLPDRGKYITTNDFHKLTKENFVERLKQANLASKNLIADFVKEAGFDEKLMKANKRALSHETSHAETEEKLNDYITSYTKLLNDLLGEVKLISTKGLTKDLINGYSIHNDARCFVEDESENYLVF